MRTLRLLPLALLACAGRPADEATPAAPTAAGGTCSTGCSRAHPDCGGWVRVAYDVTPEGVVQNARVIASCPTGEHDAAALGVVSGWRYPANESGASDIRIQIDFADPSQP